MITVGVGILVVTVLGLLVVGVLVYTVSIFNGLIRLKNNVKKAWANIDVLLKQRHDELPKLIDAVQGYMEHERETLRTLTAARTAFLNATTMAQRAEADTTITAALKTLFAVAENYPDLKANEGFLQLQSRISGLENELADRREFYNDSVNTYNIRIQSIPDVVVARMMGYTAEEMFRVSEEDRHDVEVKF